MKNQLHFECGECGFQSPKYYGRCPQCQAWNSIIEIVNENGSEGIEGIITEKPVRICDIDNQAVQRTIAGLEEFDRVLGGGIVQGSVVLIGGEPGIGKSTLLLEVSGLLAAKGKKILYYSGEESPSQIKIRAERLKVNSENIHLLTIGYLEDILAQIDELRPDYLIIDSIQTLSARKSAHSLSSVSSLRFTTHEIVCLAKSRGLTAFIIGHITKEGQLAGPKLLEHMVDVVLYFQGEIQTDIRILRAEKNRFGPADEIGVFRMQADGLHSVADPTAIFLQHQKLLEPGVAVLPVMNGLRAILIEVQALVTDSPFAGNPRRIAVGFDGYRMSMLISVLEKKLHLPFYKSDVFLNVTGGLTIRDTAADMAVCAALLSSYKNIPFRQRATLVGEVGLTGEIRPVSFLENRLKEASRQGFSDVYLPASQKDITTEKNIMVHPVDNIHDFYRHFCQK